MRQEIVAEDEMRDKRESDKECIENEQTDQITTCQIDDELRRTLAILGGGGKEIQMRIKIIILR